MTTLFFTFFFFKAALPKKMCQEFKLYHWLNITLGQPHCFGDCIHSFNNVHYLLTIVPCTLPNPLSSKIFALLFSL